MGVDVRHVHAVRIAPGERAPLASHDGPGLALAGDHPWLHAVLRRALDPARAPGETPEIRAALEALALHLVHLLNAAHESVTDAAELAAIDAALR
jgi:hypothetical protein